jgi:hypothetical protein
MTLLDMVMSAICMIPQLHRYSVSRDELINLIIKNIQKRYGQNIIDQNIDEITALINKCLTDQYKNKGLYTATGNC